MYGEIVVNAFWAQSEALDNQKVEKTNFKISETNVKTKFHP